MPDKDGGQRPALLTTATVAETERVAYCGVTYDDGHSAICTMPLSDDEIAAWRAHPDTFFGIVGQRNTRVDTPLELYDFFFDSYKKTSKERLLEFMSSSPDIERLRNLDQPELAKLYAEGMTSASWRRSKRHNRSNSAAEELFEASN